MARREVVEYTSDLSGETLDAEGSHTVAFSLDGSEYEVDLTADEQSHLRDALSRYIAKATKATRTGQRYTKTTVAADSKTVRAWAQAHGHHVPEKGRVPNEIRALYDAADD